MNTFIRGSCDPRKLTNNLRLKTIVFGYAKVLQEKHNFLFSVSCCFFAFFGAFSDYLRF